jgi:hypothetical protein
MSGQVTAFGGKQRLGFGFRNEGGVTYFVGGPMKRHYQKKYKNRKSFHARLPKI